jgi:glycosyltransferase involved in cell wall biosynthesis
MDKPLINIVICTYNRAGKIEKAIESALAQTYDNFNLIVIDDASTDNTRQVVEKYFSLPNFCYIQLGKNQGTYQGRNLAIMTSKFDAVTFHDSDDIADPKKLEVQAAAMFDQPIKQELVDKYPKDYLHADIDVVVNKVKSIGLNGHTLELGNAFYLIAFLHPNVFTPNSQYGSFIQVTNGLVNRRVYQEISGYYPTRVSGDVEFRDRGLLYGFNYRFVDQVLMTMYSSEDSLTVAKETDLKSEFRKKMEHEMYSKLRELRDIADRKGNKEKFQRLIDLADAEIAFVSNPNLLEVSKDIPATAETISTLEKALSRFA